MSKVRAICISEKKGTAKVKVPKAEFIEDFGIKGDAHAGKWHRQVSLLAFEKIEDFRADGGNVDFGAFGENLVVDGIELNKLPIGQKIKIGEVLLEVTQIVLPDWSFPAASPYLVKSRFLNLPEDVTVKWTLYVSLVKTTDNP